MSTQILTKLFPEDVVKNIIMWECYINIAERNKKGWESIHEEVRYFFDLINKLKTERGHYIRSLWNESACFQAEIPELRVIQKTANTIEVLKSYSLW